MFYAGSFSLFLSWDPCEPKWLEFFSIYSFLKTNCIKISVIISFSYEVHFVIPILGCGKTVTLVHVNFHNQAVLSHFTYLINDSSLRKQNITTQYFVLVMLNIYTGLITATKFDHLEKLCCNKRLACISNLYFTPLSQVSVLIFFFYTACLRVMWVTSVWEESTQNKIGTKWRQSSRQGELCIDGYHDLCTSPNIMKVFELVKMKWAGHVTFM
jgi:hypothetical protein